MQKDLLGYPVDSRTHNMQYITMVEDYTFRFNRCTQASRGKLFYRLVQQIMIIDPVPGYKIVGGTGTTIPHATITDDQNEDVKDL